MPLVCCVSARELAGSGMDVTTPSALEAAGRYDRACEESFMHALWISRRDFVVGGALSLCG